MVLKNAFEDMATEATLQELVDDAEAKTTPSGAQLIGNARNKFKDTFGPVGNPLDETIWTVENNHPYPGTYGAGAVDGHALVPSGDAAGSNYLKVSMSPFYDDSRVTLTAKQKIHSPSRLGYGVSQSQRPLGNEFFYGVVEADDADSLGIKRGMDIIPDKPIASVVTTSNVATITTFTAHGLQTGDRIIIVGAVDTRFNVGPVYITVTSVTAFTCTINVGTTALQNAGSVGLGNNSAIRIMDPLSRANNGAGHLIETVANSQAHAITRRNKSKTRILQNQTIIPTVAVVGQAGNYNDSLLAQGVTEFLFTQDEWSWRSWLSDTFAIGTGGVQRFTQGTPEEDADYRVHFRMRNLEAMTKPVARSVNAVKSRTNVATITTDRPHGIVAGQTRISIHGIRDQNNFGNVQSLIAASTPTATTFTVAWGSGVSATDSLGGVLFIEHGGVTSLATGALPPVAQSVGRGDDGVVFVIGNVNWPGIVNVGDSVNLWGLNGRESLEGAYRVLSMATNSLFMVPLNSPPVLNAAVNSGQSGGAVIRRTDHRLHFVRVLDHTRIQAEIIGGRGTSQDITNSVPVSLTNPSVSINNTPTVAANINANQLIALQAATGAQGTIFARIVSAASTFAQSFKTAGARVYGWHFANTGSTWAFVKLHNTTGAPVAGTTAVVVTIAIPPNGISEQSHPAPMAFGTGLAITATGGAADTDTTALTANQVVGEVFYI